MSATLKLESTLTDRYQTTVPETGSMPFRVERNNLIQRGRARTDEPADA